MDDGQEVYVTVRRQLIGDFSENAWYLRNYIRNFANMDDIREMHGRFEDAWGMMHKLCKNTELLYLLEC
jgi:Cys-tRNA synthase (O-phospho-L-seryl-tRNA:Cys-tRNA synthase)